MYSLGFSLSKFPLLLLSNMAVTACSIGQRSSHLQQTTGAESAEHLCVDLFGQRRRQAVSLRSMAEESVILGSY